jgi:DNA-binding SARP family transcriptional activator/tetratricopeptide (TPR) repeat protein
MVDTSIPCRIDPPAPAFRILGPLEVCGAEGPVRIPPGRQEVILAALLLEANRVISTEYLVDLIWDEDPPDTARTQVQICVSRLRRGLVDAGIEASITTRPPGYLLQIPDGALDLIVFHDQTVHAHTLVKEGRVAEAADLLRTATGLWRGPCLSGIPSETLQTKALRLDEDRLAAVETYIELELSLGRHHQLVGEIGRLIHENPLRERLRGQYMLALYRSGRQAEALDAYRVGRSRLIEDLGLEPGEELRLLESAILAGDPVLRVESEPLGAAPAARPAAKPSYHADQPHQLPAATGDFVGGDALVASVRDILLGGGEHQATGVVVIVGKPGIGKSTAATYIAHRLCDEHFADGQLYCDLRGTGTEPVTAREVLGRFLRALGIPGPVIPDSTDERAEMYRTILATRHMLVVLDDAASEGQIGPLLPGSAACAVIVTSRARLTGLPGGHWLELDVLTTDQALDLIGRVIGAQRVAREPDAAGALVRTVGGLPLALRIVAARLAARPHWSLASMVHRLANERHRLDELTHGEMTVRASLSLTHDGLDPADRRLLRLLSLAQGPTLPAWLAGALLDDPHPQPSDLMEHLVDVQMLDVAAMDASGDFRYRFHEIIRVFARDQLEANDSTVVQRAAAERMFGGWLAIMEQAHTKVYGGDYTVVRGDARRWRPPEPYVDQLLDDPLEWMDAEHVNLCRAVDDAALAQLDEHCWELATALVTLFESRGYLDLWEHTHQQALAAVRRTGNRRGTAALLASLGTLYLSRRQPEEARSALENALPIFQELDDRHGQALCRRDLALLERQRGDHESALALYEQSIRDFDAVGDIVGRATALTQSAHIWMRRADGTTARAHLEEALSIYRSVGYAGGEARALRRVGQLLAQHGEVERADRTLTEVLTMVRGAGDFIGESCLLADLSDLYADMGRFDQAAGMLEQALSIRERIMDHGGASAVRMDLARLTARRGDRPRLVQSMTEITRSQQQASAC